jgi:hypothetical protein
MPAPTGRALGDVGRPQRPSKSAVLGRSKHSVAYHSLFADIHGAWWLVWDATICRLDGASARADNRRSTFGGWTIFQFTQFAQVKTFNPCISLEGKRRSAVKPHHRFRTGSLYLGSKLQQGPDIPDNLDISPDKFGKAPGSGTDFMHDVLRLSSTMFDRIDSPLQPPSVSGKSVAYCGPRRDIQVGPVAEGRPASNMVALLLRPEKPALSATGADAQARRPGVSHTPRVTSRRMDAVLPRDASS